jgi:putative phage-type endonuclease
MVEMIQLKDREEWLQYRSHTIGGSDASAILGLNPWMSNADLYRIKTGEKEQEDISDKPVVKFGIEAEALMRELFRLDYPELKVFYKENNLWKNSDYPFAHASLDGWLEDAAGRKGIFENKTVNIMNAGQTEKWKNAIPDYYYTQLLHYFLVTGFDFAILKARLRWEKHDDAEVYCQIRHYRVEREEVLDDIHFLAEKEKEFDQLIKERRQPALILPDI